MQFHGQDFAAQSGIPLRAVILDFSQLGHGTRFWLETEALGFLFFCGLGRTGLFLLFRLGLGGLGLLRFFVALVALGP